MAWANDTIGGGVIDCCNCNDIGDLGADGVADLDLDLCLERDLPLRLCLKDDIDSLRLISVIILFSLFWTSEQ